MDNLYWQIIFLQEMKNTVIIENPPNYEDFHRHIALSQYFRALLNWLSNITLFDKIDKNNEIYNFLCLKSKPNSNQIVLTFENGGMSI